MWIESDTLSERQSNSNVDGFRMIGGFEDNAATAIYGMRIIEKMRRVFKRGRWSVCRSK